MAQLVERVTEVAAFNTRKRGVKGKGQTSKGKKEEK